MRTQLLTALAATILLTGATTADAQSTFLPKGVSGLGLGAGFGVGNGMNDVGGSLSASMVGVLDVGASFDRLAFDESTNLDLSALQVSPFVKAHPLKLLEKVLPVHTSLGVAWQNTSFSGAALDDVQRSMKTQGWAFEGAAYGTLALSKTVTVLPDASVSFFTGTVETYDEESHERTKVDTENTQYGVGATLALKLPTRNVISGRLGANFDEAGDARFEMNFGFTLPLGIGG